VIKPLLHFEKPTLQALYVEMCFGDTVLASGTAFLVAANRESDCVVITARHNVTGLDATTGKCLSKNAGIPDHISIHFIKNSDPFPEWHVVKLPLFKPDGSQWWVEHPVLKDKADVVALNLKWGNDVFCLPFYLEQQAEEPDIFVGPGDTVSVIGYPFGLFSSGKFPIWATGFIAQEIGLVTAEKPTFLIDCRTRQGQSGAAVVAYRPGGYRAVKDGKFQSVISGNPATKFLGLYSGRVNKDSDLGYVWHSSLITEIAAEAICVKHAAEKRASDSASLRDDD
jgi:hypothetical protein